MNSNTYKNGNAPIIELDKYRPISFEPFSENTISPQNNKLKHTRKKKRKIKIVSKIRFSISMIIFTILLIVLINFLLDLSITSADDYPKSIDILVESGDTLWSIANEYKLKNQDTRHVIYIIKEENHLQSNNLYPGDKLSIPLYE